MAIGDSTTEGLQDPDGCGGYRGWANRFAEHLARANGGIQYANLAVRGLISKDVRETQLGAALAMKPDLSTVVSGMNDLLRPRFDADEVAGHVAAMIEALTASGATVLTFTMPDMVRVMPMARLIRGRLLALNQRLRDNCRRTGAVLLDLAAHEVGGDRRLWHEDRLHANSVGHERAAMGLAHAAGLEGFEAWADPLPREELTLGDVARAELHWARHYLVPWLADHLRPVATVVHLPKRPQLTPLTLS